jgi:hypothetical protein
MGMGMETMVEASSGVEESAVYFTGTVGPG